jgi:hypothetical protein
MKRGLFASFVAGACISAIACGDPDTARVSDGEPYTPTGNVARLRLEAVDTAIDCDGQGHDLRIWLDDLPREAVDTAGNVREARGLTAFLVTLKFDPTVLAVRDVGDVRINEALGDAPPGAASGRNFTPVPVKIDHARGTVLVGAIALGAAAEATGEPAENSTRLPPITGVDPFAAGAPILLATVSVTGVAEGESAVTLGPPPGLAEVELLTDNTLIYRAAEVVDASVAVSGSCPPRAATATPVAPETPAPAPPTPIPPSTPTILTPVPASGVRDDCPEGWRVLVDDLFSVCVSDSWVVEASPGTAPGYLRSYMLMHDEVPVYIGLGVVTDDPITSGVASSIAEFCDGLADAGQIEVNVESVATAREDVDMCVGSGDRGLGGFDPIEGYAPLDGGLYLQITGFHGEDEDALYAAVREVLATLMAP